MRKTILLIILCLALLLTGCGQKITEGVVVDKEFIEEHSEHKLLPIVVTSGKTTMTQLIPYRVNYDDQYKVTIEGEFDNEIVQETFYVTKAEYEGCEIGDVFVYNEDTCDKEASYTKTKVE